MKNVGALEITTPSDREIMMTREFDAPRRLVFDAFTKPELVQRWLLGPPGWSMPVCEIDLRVGGRYRYVWRRDRDGTKMGMGGVYREIVAPERIVATERFDEAWYPGEAVGTTVLGEQGTRTTLTQTMLYESRDARDAVLKSDMEKGVATTRKLVEKVQNRPRTDLLRLEALLEETKINQTRSRFSVEAAWKRVAAEVGVAPDSMAYVGGGFDPTLEALVREAGYSTARTIIRGIWQSGDRRFELGVVRIGWRDDVSNLLAGQLVAGMPTFAARMRGVRDNAAGTNPAQRGDE